MDLKSPKRTRRKPKLLETDSGEGFVKKLMPCQSPETSKFFLDIPQRVPLMLNCLKEQVGKI